MPNVLITQGTQTAIATKTEGTVEYQVIQSMSGVHPDSFATVISVGTSVVGTIKAGVSGSAIYVTDLVVSVGSASNVEIGNGGTNLPLLGTLHLAANGGAVMNFRSPLATSVGSALVYKQSANGPLTITALGYVD